MNDKSALDDLCRVSGSLYDRGYAFGSTGNVSLRINDRVWVTPTGKPLKGLSPQELACIDFEGKHHAPAAPSKESPFHLAAYRSRPDVSAIVHLHSTYSVALSCLEDLKIEQPLPPLTPYYLMRVAPLGVLPYFRPGSERLAEAVAEAVKLHNCLLLQNHGIICVGRNLNEANDRAEELEETAKLFFLLKGRPVRYLRVDEINELERVFAQK